MKYEKYKVVNYTSILDLELAIAEYLRTGYLLIGSTFYTPDGYCQTVAKEVFEKPFNRGPM